MATKRRMTPTTKKAPIRCSLVSIAISLDSERGGSEEFTGEWLAARGELRRGAALDDAPLVEHRDAVCDRARQRQIVRDDDLRRAAIGADAADEFADLLRQDRVEVGGRLVVEDQLGVDRQRAGDRRALAHPARELARQLRLRSLQLHVAQEPANAYPEPRGAGVERCAPALWLLRSAGHQLTAKLPRTIRKSKTRIRMKLHTTADVVAVAIPSVPPRVRSPNVHGTTDAIMPNISPFTRPITTSLKCTHSSMRAKYSLVVSLMAGSMAITSAPPHTPMKSL